MFKFTGEEEKKSIKLKGKAKAPSAMAKEVSNSQSLKLSLDESSNEEKAKSLDQTPSKPENAEANSGNAEYEDVLGGHMSEELVDADEVETTRIDEKPPGSSFYEKFIISLILCGHMIDF